MRFLRLLGPLAMLLWTCKAAPTDELQDADPAQSGYLDNHNLHPATVGSSIFGILWKNQYNTKERWYAKPLTFTPPGGTQVVFTASAMNVLRVLDAVNGTLLASRTVQQPFLQSDIGCTDIANYIGIIGTPIIDPTTQTAYFFSKSYNANGPGSFTNGIYRFYAVDVLTLADRPGFPVLIDGHNADSDPTRYFVGGTVLQRASVTKIGDYVIGGFGGHCDLFNYTGMLVAVGTQPGVGVAGMYTMESSPGNPNPPSPDMSVQKGGKAGIWQGGMGFATDGNRFFLATGNGQGHANGDVPASGRTPYTTLDEVVADFTISTTSGKFSMTDYFEPYDYVTMDAGDRDLGASGFALLDPTVFKGTGISRMGVSVGKNGKCYILDANNLGGFKQGPGGTDNAIQEISNAKAVFAGAGSYPLEGGYIYFAPVGAPMYAYKLGFDDSGKPQFTLAGQTAAASAGGVGIGIPTITTYKGQAGTGILWLCDPSAGLQAFKAVPDASGTLTPIRLPPTGGLNKFQRPAFGDGRLYVSDTNGRLICMGSPVALPLQCSQPVDFGSVAVGTAATIIVNCTAQITLNKIEGCTTSDANFHCDNSTLPPGTLARGTSFSFPVVWNLTHTSIQDAKNASYGKVTPGIASAVLDIFTNNAVAQYSTVLPVSLTGSEVSESAFLIIIPQEVDFGGVVVDSGSYTLSGSMVMQNVGLMDLVINGYAWTDNYDDDPIPFYNITDPTDINGLGQGFSSSGFPPLDSVIPAGASLSIPLNFTSNTLGTYATIVQFWTTGGVQNIVMSASVSNAPIANISISTNEGGWDFSEPVVVDFGDVLAGTTVIRTLRLCNSGGSALEITKSKPPVQPELTAQNPGKDLYEGQFIDVNSCATAPIEIIAAPVSVNKPGHQVTDTWTLNTDDLTFGIHEINVTANIVARQVGPLLADGTARYRYLGCYADGQGRNLQKQFGYANNTNGYCTSLCLGKGYIFSGTEYHTECWCGNNPPAPSKVTDESLKKCAFSCPGDITEACGGDGTYVSIFYDSLNYTPADTINPSATSSPALISSSSAPSGSSFGGSSTAAPDPSTTVATTDVAASPKPTPGAPVIVQTVGPFSYVGCYTEATTGRALSSKNYASDAMTIESCASFCGAYSWFGVEYARECYCGNSLNAGSVPSSTTNPTCSLVCKGNALEYCGGGSRLQMYNSLSYTSSTPTASSASTLTSPSTSSAMTAQSSSSILTSDPVTSSTSNVILITSAIVSGPSSTAISTTSAATSLSMAPTIPPTSTTPSSTISSMSASADPITTPNSFATTFATSASSAPSSTSSVLMGWYEMGCFSDPAGGPSGGHNMPLLFTNATGMTHEMCLSSALARATAIPATTFAYAGLEYGRECYARTAAPSPQPSSLVGPRACTIACKGNTSEMCGGRNQYNLWALGTTSPTPWSMAAITSTVDMRRRREAVATGALN